MDKSKGKSRFRLAWLLIAVGCINAIAWVGLRWGFENRYKTVQLTVDYDETRLLADAYQIPHAELLQDLYRAGVRSVGVSSQTLNNLRDNGRITISTRDEAERLYPNVNWLNYPTAYRYCITAAGGSNDLLDQIFTHVAEQAQGTLPPHKIDLGAKPGPAGVAPPYGIVISASRELLTDAQMGYDPAQLRAVNAVGPAMTVTARIPNTLNIDLERVRGMLDEAKATGAHVVILSEDEVLGYSSMIPIVAREMKSRGLIFGVVEFSKQKGEDSLASDMDGQIVRVHSVAGEEAAKSKPEILEDRYVRAIRERNIRVAYIHLVRQFKGDYLVGAAGTEPLLRRTSLQQNLDFISQISRELETAPLPLHFLRPALEMGPAPAFGDFPLDALSHRTGGAPRNAKIVRCIGEFLSGLGALGGVLLLINLFFDLTPRASASVILLGILGVAVLSLSSSTGALLLAFTTGCVFAVLGILWGGLPRVWDAMSRNQVPAGAAGGAPPVSVLKCFAIGSNVLIKSSLITLLGPLLIMSLLNSWKFLSDSLLFFGPKATQLLPLVLISVAFAGEVFPHRVAAEGAAAAQDRLRLRINKIFSTPFTIRVAVTALVLAGLGLFWIARTGNDSGMEISSFELKMRTVLEKVFLTRPRTKEIFAGHPAMIFAVYFMMRRRWNWAFGAILLATIGQSDLLNTFCHIHIPVFYSVWRTLIGVIIGIIVGGIALWVYDRLEERFTPRLFGNSRGFSMFSTPVSLEPVTENGHSPVTAERVTIDD